MSDDPISADRRRDDSRFIRIRGACEHNLQHVDLDIPKHALVVFTGVSGSGKSSLAFDTLYAEGQRRYVESLSAYARQFLGQMDKPRYDTIRGLSPTIAIEQKSASSNPRSTVGTVTEIYDYLRVLFARAGTQHCPGCGAVVGSQTPSQVADRVEAWPEGTRFTVLAPLARQRKGAHKDLLDEARRQGFVRVRVDGEMRGLEDAVPLDKNQRHDLDLVVDRLVVRQGIRDRLIDSVETAFRHGDGVLSLLRADTGDEVLCSDKRYCASCDRSFPEPTPQLFSFNSPLGFCPSCQGLGSTLEVDPDKVVPDPTKSLDDGAVLPWATAMANEHSGTSWTKDILASVCTSYRIDPTRPWSKLTKRQRTVLLEGAPKPVKVRWERAKGSGSYDMKFEGILNTLKRRWKDTKSEDMRAQYQRYFSSRPCPSCHGGRLREEARHVRFAGATLPQVVGRPVGELGRWFGGLELGGAARQVAGEVLKEVVSRLRFLANVGLSYLTLDRGAATLSGGESQRIRLASQIGTELTGVTYVLDEPSIGLHPRDGRRLIETLERLRDLGNTVVVVEHDEETMRASDHLVDFGPGAGRLGGRVVAQGTPAEVEAAPGSLTGQFMRGARRIPVPEVRRKGRGEIAVLGARENNLRGVDMRIPVGTFTVVTGVSGAGKSTLVDGILKPAVMKRLHGSSRVPGAHDRIEGLEHVDKLIAIDQQPIGRTPRSNPATYTKVWDAIRSVFAQTKEARAFGYNAGRFSFNVKGGRCEACKGDGVIKVEMHFLADVYVTCESCGGKRFNDATLRVTYKGKTISDVLEMPIADAVEFFGAHKRIHRVLQTLVDVGLGYVALGQPSNTLSGGEAQRVKLSRELAKVQTGRTLYVLDEPSTGLHFADVERLLTVVQRLVEAGNTVLMVEHDLELVKAADHVIDIGPEGGDGGGQVVASGTPEQVATAEGSYTGRWLSRVLSV